jgi:2-phospho-L-lactate transferase/gluconeogenesis factor (CofD/UPF0052 family)
MAGSFMNGSNFFLKTDEIVIECDYELALLSRIRREGAKALTASYANFLTEHSSEIAALDLEQSLAAMVKHRYGKQSLVDGVWVDVALSESSKIITPTGQIKEVPMINLLM